jgi:hypothetical protein
VREKLYREKKMSCKEAGEELSGDKTEDWGGAVRR